MWRRLVVVHEHRRRETEVKLKRGDWTTINGKWNEEGGGGEADERWQRRDHWRRLNPMLRVYGGAWWSMEHIRIEKKHFLGLNSYMSSRLQANVQVILNAPKCAFTHLNSKLAREFILCRYQKRVFYEGVTFAERGRGVTIISTLSTCFRLERTGVRVTTKKGSRLAINSSGHLFSNSSLHSGYRKHQN